MYKLNNNQGKVIEAETNETENVLDVIVDANQGIASNVSPSPKVEKETAISK